MNLRPYFRKCPKDVQDAINKSPLYQKNKYGHYSVYWENNVVHGYAHIADVRKVMDYLERFGEPMIMP